MTGQSSPRYAVLWRYQDTPHYKCVWLGDDRKQAECEAVLARPAMMPGEAIVRQLMSDEQLDAIHSDGFRQGWNG